MPLALLLDCFASLAMTVEDIAMRLHLGANRLDIVAVGIDQECGE
jgi:hypothetical protein